MTQARVILVPDDITDIDESDRLFRKAMRLVDKTVWSKEDFSEAEIKKRSKQILKLAQESAHEALGVAMENWRGNEEVPHPLCIIGRKFPNTPRLDGLCRLPPTLTKRPVCVQGLREKLPKMLLDAQHWGSGKRKIMLTISCLCWHELEFLMMVRITRHLVSRDQWMDNILDEIIWQVKILDVDAPTKRLVVLALAEELRVMPHWRDELMPEMVEEAMKIFG